MVKPGEGAADYGAFNWREQIIAAARDVIEEQGPDAPTEQIADRVGLARPNFYRYFASRGDLNVAVTNSAAEELRAEISARLDVSGTPIEVISAPIAAQVIWADRHPNLYRFLVSRGYQPRSARRRTKRRNFASELTEAAERYFPHFADDPNEAAAVIVAIAGLIDASILRWLSQRRESRKRVIDRLTTQAWLIIDHHLRENGVRVKPTVPLRRSQQTRK